MDAKRRPDIADERFCPECSQPLPADSGPAHAEHHWPANTPPQYISKEAIARRDATRAGGVPREELP